MKYLVMMRSRDQLYALPFSVQRQFFTSCTDAMNHQLARGIVTEAYCTFEDNSMIGIYNCQSHEELSEYLNEIPASGLYNIKVYPLVDFNRAVEIASKNMEKVDFMPGGTVK